LIPIPDTVFGHRALTVLDGVILIVTGACLAAAYRIRWAAMGAAGLFFVLYLFLGLPNEWRHPFDPGSWTGAFELICLCGGALICGRARGHAGPDAERKDQWMDIPFGWGKYLLAAGLVVFGVQHFLYADYVAGLITPWIPFKLFWTYFVGVAFCASALSLVLNLLVRISSLLMAAMFILWLLVLHGPLVAGHIRVEPQWTSFFIAMAMAGMFLVLGGRRSLVVD
jgi:uncharacterized membrane protein YphA (DoxX/SURF4 family)